MEDKGRQRMIAGINRLGGRADCAEAVVLQQRNGLAVVGLLVVFVVVMTLIQMTVELPALAAGGIAGLVMGLGITLLTTSYWLGYCSGEVLLVKTNRWGTKAVEVASRYNYPVDATISSGMVTKKVQIERVDYVMARQFEDRLRSITGS